MSLLDIMMSKGASAPSVTNEKGRGQKDDGGQFANTFAKLSDDRSRESSKGKTTESKVDESKTGVRTLGQERAEITQEDMPDTAALQIDTPSENEPETSFKDLIQEAEPVKVDESTTIPADLDAAEDTQDPLINSVLATSSESEIPPNMAIGDPQAKSSSAEGEEQPGSNGAPLAKPKDVRMDGALETSRAIPIRSEQTPEQKAIAASATLSAGFRTGMNPPVGPQSDVDGAEMDADPILPDRILDKKVGLTVAAERAAAPSALTSGVTLPSQATNLGQGPNIMTDSAATDLGLKLDLSAAPAQTSAATSSAPIASVSQGQAPAVTQQVLAHIAISSEKVANGGLEVRLEPEELGKLRLNFVTREGGMLVLVTAERPETLDLLRRNAEDLRAGLSDMNFEGADLEFSNADTGSDWASEDEPHSQQPSRDIANAPAIVAKVMSQDDRLDIRL